MSDVVDQYLDMLDKLWDSNEDREVYNEFLDFLPVIKRLSATYVRAALSVTPRPEVLNLDALAGLAVSVDVDGLFDSEGRRLFGEVTHWQKDEGSPHGIILLIQDPEPNWKAVPQTASAPVGVEAYIEKLEGRVRGFRSSEYGKGKQDGIRECLEDARAALTHSKEIGNVVNAMQSLQWEAEAPAIGAGVTDELLTNIQRACVRGRNSLPITKEYDNSLATFDHIEDLAQQAKRALAQRPVPVAPMGMEGLIAKWEAEADAIDAHAELTNDPEDFAGPIRDCIEDLRSVLGQRINS